MGAIVVGYDGTAGAHAALIEAGGLAAELGDRLVLVFSFAATRAGGEAHDLDAALNTHADNVLDHGRVRAEEFGVPVETRRRHEDPAHGLIAAAEAEDARMVVVGSTGEHPLKGALIGSTSYKLVHLSTRPVLVVRVPH